MNVDDYLVWAKSHPGRYELRDGEVVRKSLEGAGQAAVKFAMQTALLAGIRERGLLCHMLPDGMTVRIDEATAYEPDALVYCGPKLEPSAVEVPAPIILVEVLSPSTRRIDASGKLAGYFRVPSVQHYLVIDPDDREVIWHRRAAADTLLPPLTIRDGLLRLDPPGITLALADIFPPA